MERPLHGLVVFPVRNGPVEAVVVAFDAQHQPLATVNAKKLYTGARIFLKQIEEAKTDQAVFNLAGQIRACLEEALRDAPWLPLTYFYRAEWRFDEGDMAESCWRASSPARCCSRRAGITSRLGRWSGRR